MTMETNRGQIVSVKLDPTVGAEMQKTRPCVIVSPNVMNYSLRTVMIVPLTSIEREIPTRYLIKATSTSGLKEDSYAVADQVKTIDKMRIVSYIGQVSPDEEKALADILCEVFAY